MIIFKLFATKEWKYKKKKKYTFIPLQIITN